MSQPLLELPGHEPQRDDCELLRRKIQRLEDDLQNAREAVADERKRSANAFRSMAALKQNLQPFYRALQMIFGELEDVSEVMGGSAPASREKWEIWKRKLPGKPAEFIEALLEHGELNSAQLKSLTHSGTSTVPQIIYKLNSLGLLNKNGGKFSLKDL
jgi:hypothetical protein